MNQNQNITSSVSVRKDWYCKKGLVLQERIGTFKKGVVLSCLCVVNSSTLLLKLLHLCSNLCIYDLLVFRINKVRYSPYGH